jgi:hypothetical protein
LARNQKQPRRLVLASSLFVLTLITLCSVVSNVVILLIIVVIVLVVVRISAHLGPLHDIFVCVVAAPQHSLLDPLALGLVVNTLADKFLLTRTHKSARIQVHHGTDTAFKQNS